MRNNHSSEGYIEDLLRAIVQLVCAEGHLKTILEKRTSDMENGLIDVDDPETLKKASQDRKDALDELNEIADTRRKMMLQLYELGDNGDKLYWCQVKHLASAMYCAFEAYQGSDNDPVLLDLAYEANRHFIKAVSHFLGIEVLSCASCFSDELKILKGEKDGNYVLPVSRD